MSTILYVEDEREIRSDVIAELQDAGYQTLEAENGKEGLEVILQHRPDLVLCDINMPVMSGFEMLFVLREAHPQFANIPFIFLTALSDKESTIAGMLKGADYYLTKPLDYDLMLATIKARLEHASRIDEHLRIEQEKLRDAVLSTLPHELRTPLTHIVGFSEIIKNEFFGTIGNPQYLEYANNIHDSGLELLNTIENALTLVDATIDTLPTVREKQNLETLVSQCIEETSDRNDSRKIDLSVSPSGEIPALYTNKKILRRIFSALLSNAIKFTPEEGDIHVNLSCNEGEELMCSISDSGIGIKTEDLQRITSPFGQVEKGEARKYTGAGLGLATAICLTELLDGKIFIESTLGVGTTVTLHFPATIPTALEAQGGRM